MANAIEEYLYMLKPVVDSDAWNKATGSIDDLLKKGQMKRNEALEKEKALNEEILSLNKKKAELLSKKDILLAKGAVAGKDDESRSRLDKLLDRTNSELDGLEDSLLDAKVSLVSFSDSTMNNTTLMGKVAGGLKNAGTSISGLLSLITEATSKALEILEKSSEYSNKFVSSGSMFVDANTRDTMLRFGVSSTEAQSINATEEALGISASDYALLTEGQRKAFDELMSHYQDGLDALNPDKLDRYNKAMQEYQLEYQKFQMDVQLAIIELLAESEPLKELGGTVMDFLNSVVDLLSSDTAQFVFDTFIGFLNTLIEILSVPFKLLGGGTSTKGAVTNITNNNTTNNYNGSSTTQTNPLYIQQATKTLS